MTHPTNPLGRVILTIGLSLIASPTRADTPAPDRHDPDCGLMSLSLQLSLEGHPTELEILESRLPARSTEGFSMLDLRNAAMASGLDLAAYSLGRADRPPDRAFLAFVKVGGHGHYQVLRRCGHTGKLVQVIDPSRGVAVMDAHELFGSPDWTGAVLLPRPRTWLDRSTLEWATILSTIGLVGWIVLRRQRRLSGRAAGTGAV